jgi:MoaA/NifB/PqqE/SkfB family radical SAM enzyme
MTMTNVFTRNLLAKEVGRSLTGRLEDLQRLARLANCPAASPGLRAFSKNLEGDIAANKGMAKLFLRLGELASPASKRKLAENFIYNQNVVGLKRRKELCIDGNWVPSLFTISPSMRCNLNCTGCYAGLYSKDGELSEREIDGVLSQARDMGIYFVVVSGGEPYLLRNTLIRLFKKYSDMYFLTYTNGTLIDERTASILGKLGNVAPAISVEGYQEETEERRGKGVWPKIMRAMGNLRAAGVVFGISVTVTSRNVGLVTQDAFVEYYIDKGALFGWYFMFMPVGKDPILDLVPSPEQRVYCGNRVAELRGTHPIFLADFWNDGPAAAGCLAGARQYLHILNSGRVEPCVFAHFGVDNIREKSLYEVANSPFFKAIRRAFPYNENANLKRPCMIIDNPQVLRDLVEAYVIPAGHQHSEDLIRDPKVVEWIDRYAERLRELTDPVWERMINDPQNRWYRHGKEYQDLFRFRRQDSGSGRDAAAARARA